MKMIPWNNPGWELTGRGAAMWKRPGGTGGQQAAHGQAACLAAEQAGSGLG